MRRRVPTNSPGLALLLLAACHEQTDGTLPGDMSDHRPFAAIGADEVLHLTGTEPFWGGTAGAGSLTYTTPETPEGTTVPAQRFAGRGGLGFSGEIGGQRFDLTITEGACSDGMSDRTYPFHAALMLGDDLREGCAWSDAHPFTPSGNP